MERKSGYRKSFSKPQMKQQMFNYSKIYIKLVMLSLGLHPDLYTIILIKAPERMGSNLEVKSKTKIYSLWCEALLYVVSYRWVVR